ncbi:MULTISPECIES: ATP-binding protein [unclassified Acidovorax]|uniref:ATP-binding protein n=1 Tax=unclassified Acidovorax TaxID=2684926 RepID=UPI001F31C597|nr:MULTISPECIES: ATP-binding protein [unclassified Acidovorax]
MRFACAASRASVRQDRFGNVERLSASTKHSPLVLPVSSGCVPIAILDNLLLHKVLKSGMRHDAPIPFLSGGGRATELILSRDWSNHPLGQPEEWPEGLKVSLSLVLNSPESMILCWGPQLHFFFNETYIPLLGPRVEWAMGALFDEVWSDALEQAHPIIADAMSGKSQRFNDLYWKLATDRGMADTWWTFSYSRILGADGEVAGLFIFTNETTAKVLADKALRESTERQRQTLQQMPGFVSILSGPEHRFEYVNDAYVEISGARDFLGRTVREVFPELHNQGFYELLDKVYATGESYSAQAMPIHLDNRAADQADRYIDLRYEPVRDPGGAVSGIFVGGYDVTEQVRAQRALAEANQNLAQRVNTTVRELMATEDALRQAQKMEAVGQLTGGLAHDFNNLLAAITGSLELMQRQIAQGRTTEIGRYVTVAQGAARRAAALTHRLLAFSRRQTLDPKAVDVNQLVAGMEELIRRTVGPAVHMETVAAADLWATLVDASQLESALLNLCINARDAMPHGGRITVETENVWMDDRAARAQGLGAGHYVTLSVTDTGAGMTPEVQAKAFDPFFTTKPMGQGTGLGLSMIYGFAQQSGGQVRIRSEVGVGTTMCIYLPRHTGAKDDGPSSEKQPVPLGPQNGTVLVVDDESAVRMLMGEVLQQQGYTVLEASDGSTGLRTLLSDAAIDLLVTDVGLPGGMNGRQLADAARTARPQLKVLFVTGYAENALVGNGHLEPGMAVMTKPFSIDDFSMRVREMI